LKYLRFTILIAFTAVGTILFSSCGTTGVRALPAYEPPLVKSNFQTVRTTAYTHTESDHLQFSDHNALGGQLHAAGPPIHRAENTRLPLEIEGDYRVVSYTPAPQPFSMNALADGHDIPITFNRSDLSRRRLRLGIGWTQHHRPLHGYPGGDERVGRAGRADADSKMGRLRGKFALFGAASGLQAYPPHGARASRQRRSGGAVALVRRICSGGRVACSIKQMQPTQLPTEPEVPSARGFAEIHYDLSRVTGLGELDGFFELLKWKVMGDDR